MAKKSAIGSLLINLELQTATLNKQIKGIDEKFGKMTKTFKSVGVALAGAFAVGRLKGMIQSSLQLNDALGKTADRLGINVEKLQGLQFGAEQSGVSVATLEMALQRMTRRISEAGNGTGEAVKALKEMGIEADALASMSLDKQLGVLADALSGVESEADQVRLAMKLFDSEGVKLLNMLKGGSAGLNEFQKEAQDLGFVLSREMIAKMEQANDSMNRASKVGGTFGDLMATAVAPAIHVVAEQFVSLIKNGNGGNKALMIMQKVVIGLVKGFDILANSINTSIKGWTLIFATLDGLITSNFGTVDEANQSYITWIKAVEEAGGASNELTKAIFGLSDIQIQLNKAMFDTPPAVEKVVKSFTNLDKSVNKTKQQYKDIKFVFTNAFSNMENSIVEFAKTGKASFADFANAIMEDLLRMIIRLQITIPLMRAMMGASAGGTGAGMLGSLFASGGVVSGGVQKFASGGIVSSPTVFPMASGMGLMGEAGAEAIMPLTRSSNGDLGVKAMGGGGGTIVNIYNESGTEAEVSEGTNGDGQKTIDVMIRSSVERSIGSGSLDSTFSSNFGLSRRGY